MAFAITAGTGTTVAADVHGTAHNVTATEQVQFVALASGTLGALALVTPTNPLPTGNVLQLIQVTPTIDAGNAYASGDLINDVVTITGAALASGAQTELVSVVMIDQSDNTASAYTIYVTNLSTTWGTINNAPSPADAAALGIQAIIPIASGDWLDLGGFKVAQPRVAQNIGCVCETSGSANLYAVVVNGAGTPTFASGELKLTFGFRQTM